MAQFRAVTQAEVEGLMARGCWIQSADTLMVSDDFNIEQLWHARLSGVVRLGSGARIFNSAVTNYTIAEGALIDSVKLLECRAGATFGNGVGVAVLNENGMRTIKITDNLTAQIAYLWAMWRDRAEMISRLEQAAECYAEQKKSDVGVVGSGSKIIAAGVIRNTHIADNVTVEGASHIENGTLLSGSYVGANVTASNFIAVEGSRLDTGANIERAFIGEGSIVAGGFTLIDSVLFAMSHCEAGEAVSIFGGAYTVSHHKSTLLIAGAFSFFNAGSGTNQSNHLFKSGAVHQAQHLRGCKFASDSYVMAPAVEGAFTTVLGRNVRHHDTRDLPFSILVGEADGRSSLVPAANLVAGGTMRDIEKWSKRDSRTVRRDVIDYQQYNPAITASMMKALNILHTLAEKSPEAKSYNYNRVNIAALMASRAVKLYNKGVAAAIGLMLKEGAAANGGVVQITDKESVALAAGDWLDIAGQYISRAAVMQIVAQIEGGELNTFEAIAAEFSAFDAKYANHAAVWAVSLLEQLHGSAATTEVIQAAVEAGERTAEELRSQAQRDNERDWSAEMMTGYGIDAEDDTARTADFNAVRPQA